MSVKLRLTRKGSKKRAFYRIVAADSRRARDGRFIEQLGTYDPMKENDKATIKMDRVNYWLDKGATPSDTVASLLKALKPVAE